ncbi:MAG TPA: hypothetical protein PKE16_11505 [Hyphomicrobium sp.]|nr:hypothetical protein [Hyphomicrobium sp.]
MQTKRSALLALLCTVLSLAAVVQPAWAGETLSTQSPGLKPN